MRRVSRLFALAVALLALSACQFSGLTGKQAEEALWPEHTGPYVAASRDWTRKDVQYDGVNMELTAVATLKGMPWREAFVDRSAAVYSLSADEREKLLADQRAAHEGGTGVVLALESPTYGNEQLSVDSGRWSVFALQGENKLYPLEIRPMKKKYWPKTKLKAFFPQYTRWQTYYDVRFERMVPGPVRLVVSGPAGVVEMDWEHFE